MSPDDPAAGAPRLILYDGVCGLCHRTVRWLLRVDRAGALRFAPLQGETARALGLGLPVEGGAPDTVIFVEHGRPYLRSRAFVMAARHLPRPWRWLHALRFVPAPLLDLGYRAVARVRYRIWGRLEACALPAPDQRARFLP